MANKNNFFYFYKSINASIWKSDIFSSYSFYSRLLNVLNLYILPVSHTYTINNYNNIIFSNEYLFLVYYDLIIKFSRFIDYSDLRINNFFYFKILHTLKILNNVLFRLMHGFSNSYVKFFNIYYE